jgi:MFS family permease
MTENRLPAAARLLVAGNAVSALGNGLMLPLTLIYLHQVRGIALPVVGVLLTLSGAVGLIAAPLVGVLLDRLGARRVEAHVSVHVVALSLTVNTAVIVAGQLITLRVVRLLRRSRALAAIGLIWAVSWAVFGLSVLPAGPAGRIACVFGFTGLFGVGEMFLAPTVPALAAAALSNNCCTLDP